MLNCHFNTDLQSLTFSLVYIQYNKHYNGNEENASFIMHGSSTNSILDVICAKTRMIEFIAGTVHIIQYSTVQYSTVQYSRVGGFWSFSNFR